MGLPPASAAAESVVLWPAVGLSGEALNEVMAAGRALVTTTETLFEVLRPRDVAATVKRQVPGLERDQVATAPAVDEKLPQPWSDQA